LWFDVIIEDRYSTATNITIYAPQNPNPEMRTLNLDIYFDGELIDSLYVEQEAGIEENYSYSVSPTSLTYTSTGGSKYVTLTTDSPYSWNVSSKPSWISTSVSGSKLTVTANENTAYVSRSGDITINCGSAYSKTISVSQEAAVQQSTSVGKTSVNVGSGTSATASVTLTASYNCE
jgi:hypothetical protein